MNRRRFLKQAGLWVPAALAFPAIVRAQRPPFADPAKTAVMMRRKSTAVACNTLKDQNNASSSDAFIVGANYAYTAGYFTAGSGYTVCGIDLYMTKVMTPTTTATVSIYSDSSGVPGSIVGTSSTAVSLATPPDNPAYAYVNFSGLSAALTNAIKYWIVIHVSALDATNYAKAALSFSANYSQRSADGISWSNDTQGIIKFRTYSS